MNEEVLQKLYNNGSQYFSLPDFETFKTDMQDENKLNKFRESMSNYFSIPDIETLKSDIGFNSGKQEGVDTVAATAAPEEPQQPIVFQQQFQEPLPVGIASEKQLQYQEAYKKVKLYADKIKSISDTELTQEQLAEIEKQVEEPTLTSRLVKSFGDFKTVTEEKYAYEDFLQQARQQYADQQNVDINTVTDEQAVPIAKDILRSELVGQIKDEARKQILDDFEDEYSEGFVDNLNKISSSVKRYTNIGLLSTASEIGLGKIIESDILPEGISEEYVTPVKDFFASVNDALTSKEDLEYEQGRKELKELISQASENKKEQAKSKSKEIDLNIVKYEESIKKAEELKKTINEIDNKYKLGKELSEEEAAVYNSTIQEFKNVVKDINYLSNKLNKQVEELHDMNVSSLDLEKAVDQAGRSYNALDVTVSRVVGSGLQLTSGALNLYDDLLSITPGGVMINTISDELGLPSITSSVLDDTEKTSLIESFADQLKDIDKEEFTGKVRETQNYKTAFKSGDNFLDFALDVVSGQAVNTAVTAATGGLGLAILGGAAYGNKADELEDRIQGKGDYALKGPEDIPLWKYYTTSLIVGGAEAGSEYIGLKQVRALAKSIGRVAKASPSNKAWYDLSTKKWSRKFAENVVQNAWQPIEEGGSEAIAQIAQNAADIYILGDDRNILEGVDEAFITGATFSGLAMSAPKTFVDAAVAFRSSDTDARINERTKKLGELALRKQEIKDKENKTQEDLDILKEITAEQEVLIQENYNEVGNVVTLLDELNFGQKQALIKNETKRAELIRKAKTISESKDLTKEQKENQIKELETQFKDLKSKKDSMLSRYNFDRQSQVSHLYNTARAKETGKEVKIIEAENIEDAEIKVNAALDQALQDGSITQEEYNKSKKELADLKKASTKYSISGQAINADNNLPFMLLLKNQAIDPTNGDAFVHGHEFFHAGLFGAIRKLGGNVVKISDLLYNHYKNNYITDKEQLRQFENDYKELKQKGTKEAESVWHEERIIAITKMISLAERSGKLDKSFLAKIKSAYNGLFTNTIEKAEAGKLRSGEDVFNMFLTYGTRFMSGDVKELVKLEKGLDIDASLLGEKIDTGTKFSRTALGDSIKALVPKGTTKTKYRTDVLGDVYMDIIASDKLHPLINNNLARFGVPKEQVTDEFYEDVKNQLFERSLQRFDPEKNDDLGGFVINELQRFAIPDIVNQYKEQGRFQTTEQVEAAPTEGRVRPMQIAEETTTEDIVERTEEQDAKVEEQTFREKLGIEKDGIIYNRVVNSVKRTFGTKLPSVTDANFRKALISEFKRDLMKPIKDFVGKKKDYKDFVYNNFNTIMEKIPTREWVQIEAKQEDKIFAEVVRVNASPTQVDNAISEGLYLLPGAARTAGPTIYRKLEPTAGQLWSFLTDNTANVNGARKTALVERIAQELAFDATMMILKDPQYNALARMQEIAELTGETLQDNFDAELGAIIERDPSVTKFSKKSIFEDVVKIELLSIDPSISNNNLRKIINLAVKGYKDDDFKNLMKDIYPDDYDNKAKQFEYKFNENSGILESLATEINKLDNGNLFEVIYAVKLNNILREFGLNATITKAVSYDIAIRKAKAKDVLLKIELKYGKVVNGPYLTSTVFKNVFDSNGNWNKKDIKLFRNTGIDKNIIENINDQQSFIERIVEIRNIAINKYKATPKDNGFVIKDEKKREAFLNEIGARPINRYSESGVTNEKQLTNFKKDVSIYHFSEDGAFEIPGSGLGLRPLNITTSNNTTLAYTGKGKFTVRMTLTAVELETTPLNDRNNITKDAGIEQVASVIINKFSEINFSKDSDIIDRVAEDEISLNQESPKYSKKHRNQYENSLAKRRDDLSKQQITEQVDSIFNWLDTTDIADQKKKKFEELALFYMYQPGFILPEDGYKVIEAERIASIKGIDPRSYSNPTELINELGDTVKKAYIDPDKVSTLTNKRQLPDNNSIVLYDVDNSEQGQDDLADIVESHLGKKTSPWCITAKKDGKPNRAIWDRYGNYKVAVFKNGKIHAIGVGSKAEILSNNKEFAFLQLVEDPMTGESYEIYYNIKKDSLEVENVDTGSKLDRSQFIYFFEEGDIKSQRSYIDIGRSINENGESEGKVDYWWDKQDVPHNTIPVDAVTKFSKKAKDAKGVDKDAKARDILDQAFNTILEQTTGIKATKEYSKVQARAAAQRKKYRSFFIPPSAEDFLGLMYAFLSPGKQGEKQLKFIEDNLITPMNEAFNNWAQAKYVVARDFRALRKKYKDVRKKLNKFVPGTDFTIDQAIRIYLYDKAGYTVPGISEAELKAANKFVTENADIYSFANELRAITRIPEGFSKPDENWISSTLTGEMYEISQNVVRSQFFETVNENLDTIFNEANLNKIEAYYGPKFREALEDSIYRIKTGSNRNFGNNRLLNEFNNWINGAVGTIMFLNSRSAVLQTISAINYINWSDNNAAKAAVAFGNQKQFWSDFAYLFNSPYLKERRSGLQSDINLAELQAAIAGSKNKAKAAIRYLLQKGFVFTQIADSFAIASGGATFYRNRVKTYTKQGLSQKEAEAKAFTDFQNITETNQQSARPDKISQQQAGPLGRLILAFQNTPAQYAREMKKASLDLINGRGDWKTNVSKIAYYGAIQNLLFNAMQTALFALLFDDDDELDEKWVDQREVRVVNGMVDSILRGTGIAGAVVATLKNVILEFIEQDEKGYKADNAAVIVEALNISPPIGSKARKLKSALDTYKYNKELIEAYGYDIDNPLVEASANVISAATNVPLDRALRKYDNITGALDGENAIWQRILMLGGWSKWDVGVEDTEKEEIKAEVKAAKKEAKKESRVKTPKGNDQVPTYQRKTYKR